MGPLNLGSASRILRIMAKRLLRLLTMLVLLVAPLTMIGIAPGQAMAHGAAAADMADHCPGTDKPAKEPSSAPVHCIVACAAIASNELGVEARPLAPAARPSLPSMLAVSGLSPEAAIPPPRSS